MVLVVLWPTLITVMGPATNTQSYPFWGPTPTICYASQSLRAPSSADGAEIECRLRPSAFGSNHAPTITLCSGILLLVQALLMILGYPSIFFRLRRRPVTRPDAVNHRMQAVARTFLLFPFTYLIVAVPAALVMVISCERCSLSLASDRHLDRLLLTSSRYHPAERTRCDIHLHVRSTGRLRRMPLRPVAPASRLCPARILVRQRSPGQSPLSSSPYT